MDTKKLRQKILDLAIRGKLVQQDPNDEPASVLLERIREEKERLIKEGKIKRDKSDMSHYRKSIANCQLRITNEEVPFEVPESWVWCRLGEISNTSLGKTLDKQKNKGVLKTYLRSVNIRWGYIDLDDLKEMKFEDSEIDRYSIFYDDLLICEGGEAGRCAVWKYENISMRYQNAIHRVRFRNGIIPDFYMYVLRYYHNIGVLEEYCKGVTIKHLTGQSLDLLYFPLPPFAEQSRIVSKIEECFTLIDQIETNKLSLSQFIKQVKSKVLDLAIRGKLVPQDSITNYETKITNETAANSHKKQIQITPDNWNLYKLSDICFFERGITFPSSAKQTTELPNTIPCVRTANVQEKLELNDLWYIDKSYMKKNTQKLLKANDIIMSSANSKELVGKTAFIENMPQEMTFGGFVMIIRTQRMNNKYLFYFLRDCFYKGLFANIATQTTNIANVNIAVLGEIDVSLPPSAEQQRIVSKIEQIFAQLDEIEKAIKE